jgi:hypothetical protein
MSGLFASSIDVADLAEAGRLSRRSAGAWLAGGLPPLLLALVSGPQRGEMAALGAVAILAVGLVSGTAGTAISLRFARRALDLDPTCTTARVMSILSVLSALWILVVVGLIVVSCLG